MVTADYIVKGLMQRGLPEHVARGFAMNMQDESGLNPGVNEFAPLAPDSRGGFGLYQLTGPRRVAYETYAKQRGVDPANPDAQLDFLMTELQGTEQRAAKSILGTNDANSAAAAIARDFLRPSPENLQKRLSRYGGQGGTQMAQPMNAMGSGPLAPQPEEKKSPWGNPDTWAQLAMAFNSMRMNPDAGLAQVLQGGIERRAGERKAATQRNATAEWLRSQGATELAQGVLSGAVPASAALQMAMQKKTRGVVVGGNIVDPLSGEIIYKGEEKAPDIPKTFQALDMQARAGGLIPEDEGGDGSYERFMRSAGTGYKAEEKAMGTARGEAQGSLEGAKIATRRTLDLIDLLRRDEALPSMVGPIQGRLPNVSAASQRFQSRLNQLQGTAFLEAFNMLKGGGQITEIEGQKAEQAMARLNEAQNEEDFLQALKEYEDAVKTGFQKLQAQAGIGVSPTTDNNDPLNLRGQ